MRIPWVGSVLALVLATSLPVLAQQGTAEIGGRVTDEQGGVLPGVTVVITNEESGIYREIVSGPQSCAEKDIGLDELELHE